MNTHRPFNSCFFIPLCILIPSLLHGQLVWTEPAFPTVDDQVTLYYNSALGNGELQGVIPVYIHTGVITSNSSGPSDWQNVLISPHSRLDSSRESSIRGTFHPCVAAEKLI